MSSVPNPVLHRVNLKTLRMQEMIGWYATLDCVDRDGNSVQLKSDDFGGWRASAEWMRSADAVEANPIGPRRRSRSRRTARPRLRE